MTAPWKPYTGDHELRRQRAEVARLVWPTGPGYLALFCREKPEPRCHFCIAKGCACGCYGARS